MADYWVSTPSYWCKHCKTYVRDTPIERRNHEATPRHQGNLQRFLKELHRTNEREKREEQRAKDEAARLKGKFGGSADAVSARPAPAAAPTFKSAPQRQATAEDRRRQMEQLAAMGVAVPDQFRKENAMVGEWTTTAAAPAEGSAGRLAGARTQAGASTENAEAFGVRKRKVEEDEELAMGLERKKPNWGSDVKTHDQLDDSNDLDELLSGATVLKPRLKKTEQGAKCDVDDVPLKDEDSAESNIKQSHIKEEDNEEVPDTVHQPEETNSEHVKAETEQKEEALDDLGSMFKKRKGKAVKQK